MPWLRELDAIETLRRVWLQHYHAHEQQTPWRADGELPPSALLITSPYDVEARVRPQEKHSMERIQSAFHRDAVQADAPHLIVEVTPTSSTMADGDIVEDLHARLDEQQMLPDQHLMDMGYVDAEVRA